ncbi:MAG: hypothetical protein P4M08_04765 [Oligoflexia bacterium]|nr:hypothetical protein [Oligoflexia bacterium]
MGVQKDEIADFAKYFSEFSDCYSVIGGTATLMYLDERRPGQHNKATKDLDIVVLDLSGDQKQSKFLEHFKTYVEKMGYRPSQGGNGTIKAYRFIDPKNGPAPKQIEIATSAPGGIPLEQKAQRLTEFDMSAIVCDPDYLKFVRTYSELKPVLGQGTEPIPLAKVIPIVMMKALAYINLEATSTFHSGRHASDIARLSEIVQAGDETSVPKKIYEPYLKLKERADKAFTPERLKATLRNSATAAEVFEAIERFAIPLTE